MSLLTKDYDYHLPKELIASRPLADRQASRMLVINRKEQTIEHRHFADIEEYLTKDDLVVLNDTKVIPARVLSDDGKIELLCLDRLGDKTWRCLTKPGKKMRVRRQVIVGGVTGNVTEVFENGDRLIEWESPLDLNDHGSLALPHYMERESEDADVERYQTVFAENEGAIAAPTAGLHFTKELLNRLRHATITLHVGVGTFRPVSVDDISEHDMHSERYLVDQQTVEKINSAQRVVAVGTTVTRVLESLTTEESNKRIPTDSILQGETSIFLHPPYQFQAVDALLTNFHLPKSTLMMLVSAFADREFILKAYDEAVAEKYRFFSYGDCMLII